MGEKPVSVDVGVNVDNTEEFMQRFAAAKLRAREQIGQACEGFAKDLCTVDTGLLQNSITHALAGEPAAISTYKANRGGKSGTYSGTAPDEGDEGVYIGTNVDYGPDVELGTAKQAAQPFLKPAATDYKQTYRSIMEGELKNG